MEKVKNITHAAAIADERKPIFDDDWFAEADAFVGTKLVKRGRPKVAKPKQAISIRLDQEVVDYFKLTGPNWQSRINDVLKKAAKL